MGWDGDGCESPPRMLPCSAASAADGAGMDHGETPRVPSLASQGQLRPHLQILVDASRREMGLNPAAVLLALLGVGARSALGRVCFAGTALLRHYPARQEH